MKDVKSAVSLLFINYKCLLIGLSQLPGITCASLNKDIIIQMIKSDDMYQS